MASSKLGPVNVSVTISNSDVVSQSYTLTYDATNVDGSTINIVYVQESAKSASVTATVNLEMPQFVKIEFEFLDDNTIAVYVDGVLLYYINAPDGAECHEIKAGESFTYSNYLLTIDQQMKNLELQQFEPIRFIKGVTFMGGTHFSKSALVPFYGPLTLCIDVGGESAFYVNVPGAIDDLNSILDGFRPPELNSTGLVGRIFTNSTVVSIPIGQDLNVEAGALVIITASLVDPGNPVPPQVVWTRDGQVIESGGNILIAFNGLQMFISNFQLSDSGVYTIIVSNIAGSDMLSSDIRVTIESECTNTSVNMPVCICI